MNIDSVKTGFVIDHIGAGNGMKLYSLLHLDDLDCPVAMIRNVPSVKKGKKDIIKIDADIDIDLDVIGYVDPSVTVTDGSRNKNISLHLLRYETKLIGKGFSS